MTVREEPEILTEPDFPIQTDMYKLILTRVFLLTVWQDESRIKATVLDVKPVDHKDYSKRLIINIRKLAAQ